MDNETKVREAERRRYLYIAQVNNLISDEFNSYSSSIVQYAYSVVQDGVEFSYKSYPGVKVYIDSIMQRIAQSVRIKVINGIQTGWSLAIDKNNDLLPRSINISDSFKNVFDKQIEGLDSRISSAIEPFALEAETVIKESLLDGLTATKATLRMQKYLKNPEKLNIKPGQGTYKSATANIKRIIRQTDNDSYRASDNIAWAKTPIVRGFRVLTSEAHPKYDICDEMSGDYPVDFIFTGWHVQCLCYQVPILMNDEQFNKYQSLIIEGTDTKEAVKNIAQPIEEIPKRAEEWVNNNLDMLGRLKTPPYWYTNNKSRFPELPKK